MKPIIKFTACFVLIWFVSIASCKKDKSKPVPLDLNRRPVARAGPDISVSLLLCTNSNGVAVLDGTASSDTEAGIRSYHWENIDGVRGAILKNKDSAIANVENISAGEYAFELRVEDSEGLISKDTLMIIAKGPVKEYDIDISPTCDFRFEENVPDWDWGYGLLDYTIITGRINFSPFGEFNISIQEWADTANVSNEHYTEIYVYAGNGDKEFLYGGLSINFKALIGQGGGLFSGTCEISYGSARKCDDDVFNNLPPLNISGNLNAATSTVDLSIKGKVFF